MIIDFVFLYILIGTKEKKGELGFLYCFSHHHEKYQPAKLLQPSHSGFKFHFSEERTVFTWDKTILEQTLPREDAGNL